MLFEICEDTGQTLRIDARDKSGDAPLHCALASGDWKKTTELLLRKGADPNAVNVDGSTPLHVICMNSRDDGLEPFFGLVDELGRRVPGSTPATGWLGRRCTSPC
ncbi:hypothetical protein TKK_0004679 [Trichogramma kaykai]|uniref:Uncharacterized protein n=1 Tax=Trichogramma kaykai TaxID=54128 RepID=A0ABD2XL92_9HYME